MWPLITALAIATGADSARSAELPFVGFTAGGSVPTSTFSRSASAGYTLGLQGSIPTRSSRLRVRFEFDFAWYPKKLSPLLTGLDVVGDTTSFRLETRNSYTDLSIGPQFERMAGSGRLFAFGTIGLMRISPNSDLPSGVSLANPGVGPTTNGGWSASLGGGWRFPMTSSHRTWLAIETRYYRTRNLDYFEDPSAHQTGPASWATNVVHAPLSAWEARLTLLIAQKL